MSIKMFLIETIQPIGALYIGKVNSSDLIRITQTKRRSSGRGVQRELVISKTKSISEYCKDPDATYPTPIILAISSESLAEEIKLVDGTDCVYEINFKSSEGPFAEILDGQHRVKENNWSYSVEK